MAQRQQGVPGAGRKDTEAILQADIRYELVCRKRYSTEDCSKLFSVFTRKQDVLAICPTPCATIITRPLYLFASQASSTTRDGQRYLKVSKEPSKSRTACHG